MLNIHFIDNTWTLFLDRDGVINKNIKDDYVKTWDEFEFYPDTLHALEILSNKFKLIIIVTNQKGISKKLYTIEDLNKIHRKMNEIILQNNGRIDSIFFAPDIESNAFNRKPQIGMAVQAKEKYPQIDCNKSIMVGNNLSDMEFGKNAGMKTVFIKSTIPDIILPNPLIDIAFSQLIDFANYIS